MRVTYVTYTYVTYDPFRVWCRPYALGARARPRTPFQCPYSGQ